MRCLSKNVLTYLILLICVVSFIPVVANAAMYFNVYGSLESGDWNPFKTDVASTYGYVGWEKIDVRNNFGSVEATIYWKDSDGQSRSTTNSLSFKNIAGKTNTISASSGNDNSKASSYHYGYLHDNISKKDFYDSGHYYE